MVTTPNNHSPTSAPSPAPPSGETNFIRKTLPSPWAQVVRGGAGDTESQSPTGIHQSLPSSSSSSSSSLATAEQPPPPSDDSPKAVVISCPPPAPVENSSTIASDGGDGGNVGGSKKLAWNKPSNGVVEIGPVMGAESWPALSESAKIPGKLPPESSSLKIAPVAAAAAAVDGSSSPSTSQGPIIPHSPQRQGASNARSSSVTNINVPNRPRPMRRLGGSNIGPGPAQSSLSNPPTPPPLPHFPAYQLHPGYRNMVPSIPDSSPRDHHRNNNWDARPLVGGSSRRGHFGSHPRGDGSYHHNNYSSRRDHDRGNYANTRDAHSPQPRMPPRGILRHPPPSTAAFLGPQPLGPFPAPVAYPDFYYFPTVTLDPFRGMPVFPHMPSPAAFFPAAESSLSNVIVNQIDYYFSDINLVNDEFLKSNMDEEGWVPISLIANFPRVKNLTTNIQLILDSMRNSTVVEVQGDKLRRRNDWMNFFMPSAQVQADSGSVSPVESKDNSLTADFQTITLEKTKDEGESSRQSQLPNGSDVSGNTN